MAKTATITLGGTDYTIRAFNLDELQDVTELIASSTSDKDSAMMAFKVLRIALKRAEPKIDSSEVEASPKEVFTALGAILKLAGLEEVAANPPAAGSLAS